MTATTWRAFGPAVLAGANRRRAWLGVFLILLALLAAWGLTLSVGGQLEARLNMNATPAIPLPVVVLPVRLTTAVLEALCFGLGAWLLLRPRGRRSYALLAVGLTAIGLAVIVWAARGTEMSFEGLLASTLIDSVPLMFGAIACLLCERTGVINMAIEGEFLAGAFLGAMIGSVTANLWLGILGGAVGGAALGALLALLCVRFKADQIIVGFVIITFATGLTSFLDLQVLTPNQAVLNSPQVFSNFPIPLLDRIPLLGPIVFDQNVFLYMVLVLLVVVQVALFHTRWGLRVRAVGEHPRAADTVGIAVNFIRYRNVILGAAIGGVGGAALSIGSTGEFTSDMSAGLGFIALAAMIFGRWKPLWAAAAALLFGFADSAQSTFGVLNVHIPSPFLLMFPYVVTILAVAGLVGRVRPPGADGVPYQRE